MNKFSNDIVETLREPLVILDEQLRVMSANPAFYHAFRVRPEDTLNQSLFNLGNGEWNIPQLRVLLEEVIPEKRVFEGFEMSHDFPSLGYRTMVLNAHTVHRENGAGAVIALAIEDITDRKLAEDKVTQYTVELERSNSDLQQFAYVASHDLQEPLRAIAGYLQLLQKRYGEALDDKASHYIQESVEATLRMQTLIVDLLQYSRINTQASTFTAIDSMQIVKQVLDSMRNTIAEAKAVITCDSLPTIMADRVQMTQVFQNLISNAIKFRTNAPPIIHVSARRKGKAWLFSVQDNGIGIDPEFNERIFVIFQRLHTRREYIGTGIGLSICKRVIERHHGRIWIESHPGSGSTFLFTIPDEGESHEAPLRSGSN